MSYSALSNTSYLQPNEVDVQEIEKNISVHGVTPGGSSMMKAEAAAANESILSGLYVSWSPHPSIRLTSGAFQGIKDGTDQCCRVGGQSRCLCGHSLASHKSCDVPRKISYIKPPSCSTCKCSGYSYCPARPEECGQWWLPRRKDFDIKEWRKVSKICSICSFRRFRITMTRFTSPSIQRIREKPHEYVCIGCEQKVSDHETVFESRKMRVERGAAVDSSYIPLIDNIFLTSQVLEGKGKIGGIARTRAITEDPNPFKSSNKSAGGEDSSSCASSTAVRYR